MAGRGSYLDSEKKRKKSSNLGIANKLKTLQRFSPDHYQSRETNTFNNIQKTNNIKL